MTTGETADAHRFSVDLAQGWFSSTLELDGRRYDTSQHMTTAGFTWEFAGRWALRASVGGVLYGTLGRPGDRYVLGPGVVGALGARYRILQPKGAIPFIDANVVAAASWSPVGRRDGTGGRAPGVVATDLRFGATVGWSLWDVLSPYASVRAFGGPVLWEREGERITGSDIHHYQVALGTAVSWPGGAVFFDGSFLGERSLTAGLMISL